MYKGKKEEDTALGESGNYSPKKVLGAAIRELTTVNHAA